MKPRIKLIILFVLLFLILITGAITIKNFAEDLRDSHNLMG